MATQVSTPSLRPRSRRLLYGVHRGLDLHLVVDDIGNPRLFKRFEAGVDKPGCLHVRAMEDHDLLCTDFLHDITELARGADSVIYLRDEKLKFLLH